MSSQSRLLFVLGLAAGAACLTWSPPPAQAYVEAPYSLGQIMNESTGAICVMRVEQVDREKNLIIYRKVRDLKGKHPTEIIKHNIGRGGFNPREWQYPMAWAEVGKTAVFFHNGGASETCIGTYWYQAYAGGEWWNMSHGEPFLLRSFAGNIDKLIAAVADMQAGKEVVVPCMVDGNKDDLHLRRAKIQRLRASLKLGNYNAKRDFVGWGGEDFVRINSMPGFTHMSGLARVDPEAQAISALDIDGDGKPDLCLVGASKIALLQNGGEALTELNLPNGSGCRAAVWADYNGDGLPDLLLATATGPKLYTNLQLLVAARTRLQPDLRRLDRPRRRRPARHPSRQRLPRPAPVSQRRARPGEAGRHQARRLALLRPVLQQGRQRFQHRVPAGEGNQLPGQIPGQGRNGGRLARGQGLP